MIYNPRSQEQQFQDHFQDKKLFTKVIIMNIFSPFALKKLKVIANLTMVDMDDNYLCLCHDHIWPWVN
jgi:hypothetical protein